MHERLRRVAPGPHVLAHARSDSGAHAGAHAAAHVKSDAAAHAKSARGKFMRFSSHGFGEKRAREREVAYDKRGSECVAKPS